jgi:hypothetical protein
MAGDGHGSRRRGCGAARPGQEMPNLEDLLLLFRCFPEVWRGRFGLFLCHFLLLALAFHPSGWGLVSDSGTIACLELLW